MKKLFFAIILSNLFSGYSFAQTITKDNWLEHEQIKEVRELYLFTENHITSTDYKEFQLSSYSSILTANIILTSYIDENLGIRKLKYDQDGDGKTLSISMYYDKYLILRFALINVQLYGTVNDEDNIEKYDYRIYFNNTGELIWKVKSVDGTYSEWSKDINTKDFDDILFECPYETFHNIKY